MAAPEHDYAAAIVRDRANAGKLRAVVEQLVSTVEATGGVIRDGRGYLAPVADPDWIDIGEAYFAACNALGKEMMVREDLSDEPTEVTDESETQS